MNKEIEELLNKLKDKDWYEEFDLTGTKWIELKQEETNLLLSYIEQLEVEIKELNDSITWWTNRFNAVERDNRELKKQKDDVVEYIRNELVLEFYNDDLPVEIIIQKLLRMLGEIDD